ncbi:MAG TPA: arginine deiminase family protein [Acidimicrobiales bacterium]|nr:arginine deiminase family protein [Acidimicrobiales bacterium]
MSMGFGVESEVGPLRQVVVHRPGSELSRLTRQNARRLLFAGVPDLERARDEHDAFTASLTDQGVRVHYFARLLAETLDIPEARAFVLDRACVPATLGPALVAPVRSFLDGLDSELLVAYLVGGIAKGDLHPRPGGPSLSWETLSEGGFLLPPLPNHLYQRDSSCWIYRGVCISPMAKPVRRREWVHTRAIYRYHPMFAGKPMTVYHGGGNPTGQPVTVEGGDVHVVGHGCVLIGMGERTSPMAVETLAGALFGAGPVHTVIAVELPPAVMHLDMVMTMVDRATFVVQRRLTHDVRSWTLRPSGGPGGGLPGVQCNTDLWRPLSQALGEDVRVLPTDGGVNYLAVAPGVVYGYQSNYTTNTMLRRHGIEVVSVAGRELQRGRGGPRCMSCPIEREA